MKNTLFTCDICKEIFKDHTDLKNHIRRHHQSMVKVKFPSGDVAEIKRAEDNTFKCKCGKGFKLPNSLHRHAKVCNNELIEQEEEAELMDMDDFDASEQMNMDNRIMPIDC